MCRRYLAHWRLIHHRVLSRASCTRAGRLFFESSSRSIFLLEHDLFGKPVSTFPDHALTLPGAGGCLAAIDPARAFADDESVVLESSSLCLSQWREVRISSTDGIPGRSPSCVWPLAMNVRCRTYSCTAAAPRRRVLAVLAGSILELLPEGNKFPCSELILSGRVPHICNPWV